MFGDSLTTSPSYASLLAWRLNVATFTEVATGGWTSTNLLTAVQATPPTVGHSVVLIGANDVLNGVAAATIEANLTAIAATMDDPHFVCILPCGNHASWSAGKEAVRVAVNTWIKANLPLYTDAEAILGDSHPTQPVLRAQYDSGDGLHINGSGDLVLAEAIFNQGYGSVALA